jgi:hypothetical protein
MDAESVRHLEQVANFGPLDRTAGELKAPWPPVAPVELDDDRRNVVQRAEN